MATPSVPSPSSETSHLEISDGTPITIRWMVRADMRQVVAIEADSFESPWGPKEFRRVVGTKGHIGEVAVIGAEIVGYVVYEMIGRREGERAIGLLNLAVAPALRRQGIGACLIQHLQSKWDTIKDIVADTNLDAHLFLQSQGFVAEKILHNLFDAGIDGYRFVWDQTADIE